MNALRLLGLGALLALAASCRDSAADFGGGPRRDATATQTCTENADCGGNGICIGGICEVTQPCLNDTECTTGVCHTTRGFCVECDGRHANECQPGETCQFDFTCVPIGGGGTDAGARDGGSCSGSCTDRTMCGSDQVCRGGACCAPPSRCTSINDCPMSAPECNGATGLCFGGDSCSRDADCATRAGCGGGACFCDQPAPGAPGQCRARPNECNADVDCNPQMYIGKFCSLTSTPRRCLDAPMCTDDVPCATAGLICNTTTGSASMGRCVNGRGCPMGSECPATQLCERGRCIGRNCVNTPAMCTAGQTCNPTTGRCEQQMMGGNCTRDTDCNAGFFCNTSAGVCRPGCRDNSECPMGICNASHACESAAGGLCGPCNTNMDCPAGTECYESPLTMTKTCRETCNQFTGQTCMLNPNAICLFVRCTCGP